MYFIPRNNTVYNYIAHTNVKRRYGATLFLCVSLSASFFYGIYRPLGSRIVVLQGESLNLQHHYQSSLRAAQKNAELTLLVDRRKANMRQHEIEFNDKEEYCSKRMHLVFDAIKASGLTLNSYGSCKEQDKKWYIKDSSHIQCVGTLSAIMEFLKITKESQYMIRLSHLAIIRAQNNQFQLSGDLIIVVLKK